MSYQAAIASSEGDDTTLAKSFIISLENVAANRYARLAPRSIASWAQLKKNPGQFSRFPSRSQYGGRFLLVLIV
jgi:hypothetical protein